MNSTQSEPSDHAPRPNPDLDRVYDYIVVGSGFGGSVSALRLAEKGYDVLVVEMGKRWHSEEFPKTNWNARKFLWLPSFFCYGIQKLTLLRDTLVLSGTGVGGGSLVYANTLLVPTEKAFQGGNWPDGTDWQSALAPHYEAAQRILGVNTTPRIWKGDERLHDFAVSLGKEATFERTEVAVLFGEEPGEEVGDPFFDGSGPERSTCNFCGGCMVGCRHNAKNTLDKNYLYFAEKLGTEILPETKATLLQPADDGGYLLQVESSTRKLRKNRRTLRAKGVVLSGGALGTVDLLLKCKDAGSLPDLPPSLGHYTRTNSEVLCGATARSADTDYSEGIAIASGFYPSEDTYIEVVRYSEGSDFMGFLATILTDGGSRLGRPLKWIGNCIRRPIDFLRTLKPFGWARRTTILLVMQTVDNSMQMIRRRLWFWPFTKTLWTRREPGQPPIPTYIPVANQAAKDIAERMDGFAASAVNEVVLNVPTTAHLLGGAALGSGPDLGVVDSESRVYGYENLYVADGSIIPSNLGVNPSLTIMALAEHAMSHIPSKDPAAGNLELPTAMRAASNGRPVDGTPREPRESSPIPQLVS